MQSMTKEQMVHRFIFLPKKHPDFYVYMYGFHPTTKKEQSKFNNQF